MAPEDAPNSGSQPSGSSAPDAAEGPRGTPGGEPRPPVTPPSASAEPGAPSGPQTAYAPGHPGAAPGSSPPAGQPWGAAPEGAGPEQAASGGWAPPRPPHGPQYANEAPYPPGGQPARPPTGAQPSPPPGQNPYDWRPPSQPNAPQTGPQAPPAAGPPSQPQQAAHGSTAEPRTPPAADGGPPNPYQVPGSPPQPPQTGPQAPPAPPYHGQQAPYSQQPAPGWGPPQSGGPPGPSPAAATGFQYHTHLPHEGGPGQSRPETADALDADSLVRGRRPPSKGWRRVVRSATFGIVDPGMSAAETRRRGLTQRATTHVAGGHHRVAVLSLKGGVGKTTTTVALGSTLSSLRGDRVLAVDANPDRGTLSDKVRLETAATIRDLLNERDQITRYADIRGFTSQAASRLEILASDRDPAVSEAFSEADYREVTRILEHFYSICITDCGTGLLHSAMRGVLGLADQVVLVSSASVDGARSASATLDWLQAHEYGYHVRGAVVVLSMVRQDGKSSVDLNRLEEHFASRCRAVVRVPWDAHLEEGAELDLEHLAPATRDAYLQLAATVGEAFAWPR
ncbi:nucleotide-binding protein [Lipingzhangella halophila]|uniref:nucleotide-binding protein n=1 Tax=Lipingzhangella halophila TaxID=1783352 RepID=UPI00406BA3AD